MQVESASFSAFSARTEALAAKLNLRVIDLPPVLGVSLDMLTGYRSGRYKISAKAWRKLAAAETAHGLAPLQAAPQRVEDLCAKIREEFYLPEEHDFAGLSSGEGAEVLRAMADAMVEMERRKTAYAARATREGLMASHSELAEAREDLSRLDAEANRALNDAPLPIEQPAPTRRRRAG